MSAGVMKDGVRKVAAVRGAKKGVLFALCSWVLIVCRRRGAPSLEEKAPKISWMMWGLGGRLGDLSGERIEGASPVSTLMFRWGAMSVRMRVASLADSGLISMAMKSEEGGERSRARRVR